MQKLEEDLPNDTRDEFQRYIDTPLSRWNSRYKPERSEAEKGALTSKRQSCPLRYELRDWQPPKYSYLRNISSLLGRRRQPFPEPPQRNLVRHTSIVFSSGPPSPENTRKGFRATSVKKRGRRPTLPQLKPSS